MSDDAEVSAEHAWEYPSQIYFDTQPLMALGWPQPSTQLLILMRTALLMSAACIIPAPVLEELERRWERSYVEESLAVGKIARRIQRVGGPEFSQPPPVDEALKLYRRTVEEYCRENNVFIAPMTKRSTAEVFKLSAGRDVTFTGDKDTGFQDAVILLSALDHLPAGARGVLISRDAAFSSNAVSNYVGQSGKRLEVVLDVAGVQEQLEKAQAARTDLILSNNRLKVMIALHERWGEVTAFVRDRIEIAPAFLGDMLRRVRGVQDVQLQHIEEDDVSINAVEKDKPDAPVAISVVISALFAVVVERNTFRPPPPAKIGDELFDPTPRIEHEVRREVWNGSVRLDATATMGGDGLTGLRLENARVESAPAPAD